MTRVILGVAFGTYFNSGLNVIHDWVIFFISNTIPKLFIYSLIKLRKKQFLNGLILLNAWMCWNLLEVVYSVHVLLLWLES